MHFHAVAWWPGALLFGGAALVGLGSCLPVAAQDVPPLPGPPLLKLDDFEPAIRAQVQQAAEHAQAHAGDAAASGRFGMTLHAYEQYELAALCYGRARHLAPADPRWHYYHGLVQTALGAQGEAVEAFKTALRLRRDDLPAKLRLADVLLSAARFRESQPLYEELVVKKAALAQAHYALGQIQVATGRLSAGIEHFRQAVAAFPEYGRAHYALGLALRDQGQGARAQEHLTKSLEHRYREPVLDDPLLREVVELNAAASDHLLHGLVLEARGELERSIAAHERALRMNPGLVQAHINLITLYGRGGQIAKAEEHYRAAVAANPELADGYFNFGLVLAGAGRSAEAGEAFRLSCERNPFNPEAHYNYSLIIERDGRLDEAAAHYRQAIENDPHHRLARFHLGRILVYQDRLPEAIVHLRETLVPEDENTPRFTYALGATHARTGEWEQALRYLREASKKATGLGQTELAERIERDIKALTPER